MRYQFLERVPFHFVIISTAYNEYAQTLYWHVTPPPFLRCAYSFLFQVLTMCNFFIVFNCLSFLLLYLPKHAVIARYLIFRYKC